MLAAYYRRASPSGSGWLNERLKVRILQTERSESSRLTAYVAVVEFGAPRAKVMRR
jgi:hypothetical protein